MRSFWELYMIIWCRSLWNWLRRGTLEGLRDAGKRSLRLVRETHSSAEPRVAAGS